MAISAILPWLPLGAWAAGGLARLGSAGLRKLRQLRDPVGFRKQEALQEIGITPEQYDVRRRNMLEGLQALKTPQQVFAPRPITQMSQRDVTAGLSSQIGGNITPQRPGGLAALLDNQATMARRGYESAVAQIGARRMPGRSARGGGGSSAEYGMMRDALKGGAIGYTQNVMKLLGDYATRNAMADIEAGQTSMEMSDAEKKLQSLLNNLRMQQQAGMQEGYLGQQQYGLEEQRLRNMLSGEERQQALRKYQVGMQSPYAQSGRTAIGGI